MCIQGLMGWCDPRSTQLGNLLRNPWLTRPSTCLVHHLLASSFLLVPHMRRMINIHRLLCRNSRKDLCKRYKQDWYSQYYPQSNQQGTQEMVLPHIYGRYCPSTIHLPQGNLNLHILCNLLLKYSERTG
jgi:hypothetical protein